MGTPENAGRSYNYYAFISYSHADKAWASWIQKSLERSRIPAAISRDEPSVPRRIAPVFRDDTDLVSHGSVLEVLKKELEDSRFLIVICSPDSAKSSWVSDEIQAFIDMGRADRIIPLIVRGVPHSKDPETECLPPALLTLDREAEPLGIDVQEHGKNGAYVRVVASLLGVKLDQIIQRDRKIRRRKRIACVSLAIAALAIAGFLVWYNVPFVSLYRDYTDRWDIPAGIGRITASEQAKTAVSYRFTTRRGRVESVERINSAGVLTEGEFAQIWTEPALVRCQYADTGLFSAELIGKEYYSADHKKLYSVQYTRRDGSRQRAADLIMPGESVSAFSATARTSDASAGVDLASLMQSDTEMRYRSMISRYLQTYDESGFLITRLYMRDNWNHPVSDDDDIYGVQFGYDADGRVTRIRYLDADGNVSGCLLEYAGEDYEYDPEGRIVRITRVDSSGSPVIWALSYVTQVIEYDETGRPSRIVCLDRSGNPMPSPDFGNATGVSIVRDAQGNILRTVFLGTDGNPAACIGGFAEIRRTFDASGRATSESTYDADGNPVADQSGVYTYAYTYDGAGNCVLCMFLGADGQPVHNPDFDSWGLAFAYSEGFVTRITWLDAGGQPYEGDPDNPDINMRGYAHKERAQNAAGQLEWTRFLNAQGELTTSLNGASQIHYTYKDGSLYQIAYFDGNGAPVTNIWGYSVFQRDTEDGLLKANRYLDTAGNPTTPYTDTFSAVTYTYDDKSRLLSERFLNEAGEPVMSGKGYATCNFLWDLPADSYKQYLDENGQELTPDEAEAARRSRLVCIMRIEGFIEDAPGEQAGLRRWDLFVRYNDWSFADCWLDANELLNSYLEKTGAARETEKTITVLRRENGSWQEVTVTAPEGMLGCYQSLMEVSVGFAEDIILKNTAE